MTFWYSLSLRRPRWRWAKPAFSSALFAVLSAFFLVGPAAGQETKSVSLTEASAGLDGAGGNARLIADLDGVEAGDLPITEDKKTGGDSDIKQTTTLYLNQPSAGFQPFSATAGDGPVNLAWNLDGDVNGDGYNVYRSTSTFSDIFEEAKLNTDPVSETSLTDVNGDGNQDLLITGSDANTSEANSNETTTLHLDLAASIGPPGETALAFDENGENVAIPNSSDINLSKRSQRTIEAFFKVSDKTINARKQVVWEEGGIDNGFNIYVYDGSLYIGAWSETLGWNGGWLETSAIESDRWHHVALMFNADAGVFEGYLDGAKFGSVSPPSLVDDHNNSIGIGANRGGTKFHDGDSGSQSVDGFEGRIDEVRIWNEPRTASQIQNNRDALLTGDENGLIAYWSLEDEGGSTATDQTGNGHDGTVNGATWVNSQDSETVSTPTNVAATPGNQSVDFTWSPGGDSSPAGYNVYRSTESFNDISDATKLNSSLLSSESYRDTEVTNGTKYFYRVTAVDNDGNESALSNQDSAIPSAADILFSEDWESGSINTDIWNKFGNPSPAVTGVGFESNYGFVPNGDGFCDSGAVTRSTFPMQDVAIDWYAKVDGTADLDIQGSLMLANDQQKGGTCSDEGDDGQRNHVMRVKLQGDRGPSRMKVDLEGKGTVHKEEVDLSWHHLRIELKSPNIVEVYLDGSLAYSTTHDFSIDNFRLQLGERSGSPRGDGIQAHLDKIEIEELNKGDSPVAPTDLSADPGDEQVDLTWSAGEDSSPAGYNVYRSTESFSDISNATKLNSSLLSSENYLDTEVTNGTEYFYRVTAVDSDGNESSLSNEVSVTPTPKKLQVSGVEPASGVSLDWEETVTLTVTITDGQGNPVEGADLNIEDNLQSFGATRSPTDENGEITYELDAPNAVSEGEYSLSLTASKNGFEGSEPREFIANVKLKDTEKSLLDAIAKIAFDQIKNIRRDYKEKNIKHLAYLSAGIVSTSGSNKTVSGEPLPKFGSYAGLSVSYLIDVDDLLRITEEGKNGKVTIYVDIGASGPSASLFPVTFAFLEVPFEREATADPNRSRLAFELANIAGETMTFSFIPVNSKGEFKWAEVNTSGRRLNVSASALNLNWNLLRGELKAKTIFEDGFSDLGSLSEVSKEDFNAKSLLEAFTGISLQDGITYNEVLTNGKVAPFTTSDSGEPQEVNAYITHGRGGFDADGDGIPDNVCPPPAENFSRIPKFNLNFVTGGTTTTDYLLKAESIPEGWAVETRDDPDRGESSLNIGDVPPGTEVTTDWNMYRTGEGSSDGQFRFVLYEDNLFSDDPLDTLLVDAETYEEKVMAVNGKSPVDLEVHLPGDSTISKDQFNPVTSSYTRADIDGSGDTDTQVLLTDPPEGEYEVDVVPADTARPSDTYSLEVAQPDGSVDTLAAEQEVGDAPDESYVTSQGVPVSPSSLKVSTDDDSHPQLEWTHRGDSDGLSRYRIYRDTSPFNDSLATQAPIDSVGGSTLSYTDESAEPGDTYYYRVTSVDESGTESKLSEGTSVFLYPQEVPADVQRSFGDASGPEDYQLAALPGQVDRSVSEAVEGEAGADWQAFWDNGSSQNYLQKFDGSDLFSFQPGNGFWVTSRQDLEVETTIPTVPLRDEKSARVPLHEGWNIVSNPLDKDVSWAVVDSLNDSPLQPLWRFDGSFARADTFQSAKEGEAFYFLNDAGLDSLSVPYPGAPAGSGKTRAKELGPLLTIRARPEGAEAPTSEVRVGFDENADKGLGRFDEPAPPGRFSSLSLRLQAPGEAPLRRRSLMTERRPPKDGPEGGHTFDLRLQSRVGGPIRITASGLKETEGAEAKLLRPSTGRSYDLVQGKPVAIEEADSTGLKLAIGSASYVEAQAEQVVPDKVRLTSYPNPTRGQATIEYTLPEAEEVTLEVYDVLGRRVATLEEGSKQAGRHEVRLEADGLPSGVYFGRLEAGGETRTQKITVVR